MPVIILLLVMSLAAEPAQSQVLPAPRGERASDSSRSPQIGTPGGRRHNTGLHDQIGTLSNCPERSETRAAGRCKYPPRELREIPTRYDLAENTR
jgi:hypothetical protein